MCKINFAGFKGWNFKALVVGEVEMGRALACVPPFAIWGASSRRGGNGARIYLYARYHFGALVVKAHKLLQ